MSCSAQMEVVKPLFKGSNHLEEPYGVCSHISRRGKMFEFDVRDKEMNAVNLLGATYIRTDYDWGNFRNNDKGPLNFGYFDEIFSMAQNSDKKILGIFTPSSKKEHDKWELHTASLVKRYAGKVNAWEIVNEADLVHRRISGFNSHDYMRMLKSGSRLVKKNNRHAKVIYGGISMDNISFIDTTFVNGASHFFDIMNIHVYTNKNEPEYMVSYLKQIQNLMQKYKIKKPIWISETGYTTKGKLSVDEEAQAIRLPRMYLLSFAYGVDKVFWYTTRSCELDDSEREWHFGIFHKDYAPKPAFFAYRTLVQMCPNKSSRPKLYQYSNIYIATWKQPNKEKVWAIWTSKGEKKVDLEIKGNYEVYDSKGMKKTNIPQMVTPSVLYVVGATNLIFERNEIN